MPDNTALPISNWHYFAFFKVAISSSCIHGPATTVGSARTSTTHLHIRRSGSMLSLGPPAEPLIAYPIGMKLCPPPRHPRLGRGERKLSGWLPPPLLAEL